MLELITYISLFTLENIYIPLYCTWKLFYFYAVLSDFSSYTKQNAVFEQLVPGLIVKLVFMNERLEMGLLFKHFCGFVLNIIAFYGMTCFISVDT